MELTAGFFRLCVDKYKFVVLKQDSEAFIPMIELIFILSHSPS